jgi:hypothetical protein
LKPHKKVKIDFYDKKLIWRTIGECIFFEEKWPSIWRTIKIAEIL